VDEAMGQLIEALKSKGLWDDALVIFLSDHGESLGEHNIFFEHQYNVFEETARAALVIRPPLDETAADAVAPHRTSSLASPMDIMPTILDYLDVSFKDKIDGQTLLPILHGTENTDRAIFLEFPEVSIPSQRHPASFAVRTATHKLIRVLQPNTRTLIGQAVFDIIADPLEQRPIRYDQSVEPHHKLSKQVDAMLKAVAEYEIPFALTSYEVPLGKRTDFVEKRKDKGPKPIIKQLSDEQIEKLRSLGYIK